VTKYEEIPIIRQALISLRGGFRGEGKYWQIEGISGRFVGPIRTDHEHWLLRRGTDTRLPFLEHNTCLCVQELVHDNGKNSNTGTGRVL